MPKKENSTENKALLEEMFECAMANNFNAFSKLLDNKDEHSLVEDDANLGTCLMMMAQAINSEPDIIKREEVFKIAQKVILLIDVPAMGDTSIAEKDRYEDHYNILGGVVNSSTDASNNHIRSNNSTVSGMFIELIEAGFTVTYQVRDAAGIPVKDILMFAAQQASWTNPQPDITEIVRIILRTKKAPGMEGDLSSLALFMIDHGTSPRALEKKEIFRDSEKMGKILEAFHTSSGASEEICENIRDKLNGEYGTHLFSTKKPEGSPQPTYPTSRLSSFNISDCCVIS